MRRPNPSFDVVIIHYASPTALERCLNSLAVSVGSFRVFVVDNASPNWQGSLWQKRFPDVTFLNRAQNGGYAVAANEGARAGEAPYVLVLNADTVVFPYALVELQAVFETSPHAGLLGPQLLDTNGRLQLSSRGFPQWWTPLFSRYSPLTWLFPKNRFSNTYLHSRDTHRQVRPVDWVSGAAMAVRRSVWETVGGMDETFFLYMEDVDFCRRIHQAGGQVLYVPQAQVRHAIGTASRQRPLFALQQHHRSIWRYYKKHFQRNLLLDAVMGLGILARFFFACFFNRVRPWVYSQGGETFQEARLKRPLDWACSLLGLVLTAPLWMLVPLCIWLYDRGPIFYRQKRVGRYGHLFNTYKFRTMILGAEKAASLQAGQRDPRITPIGHWIRRAAIDEIPQILNILKGDMSLVGPRALMPNEIELQGPQESVALQDIAGFSRRQQMRPGLTGIAQVSARRDVPRRQKFRYDLLYSQGHSLLFDFKLIFYSVWISLTGSWGRVGQQRYRRRMVFTPTRPEESVRKVAS